MSEAPRREAASPRREADRQAAQTRVDALQAFRRELGELERNSVLQLTDDQRAGVDAHIDRAISELQAAHDVDVTGAARGLSWGLRIASALGGTALCAAVWLFFNRYAGHWPTWLTATLLATSPIALVVAADRAARRERTLYYASLLSLVAIAAFVANLVILGRIFNLPPTPNAFAAWGALALALAYHLGLRLPLVLGLTSLLFWVVTSSAAWRGWWWLDVTDRLEDFMIGGVCVATAPFVLRQDERSPFGEVYRVVGTSALLLAMLPLSLDGELSRLPWDDDMVERLYQLLGLVASAATIWLGVRRRWTGVVNSGVTVFVLFLLVRLFQWWWDWLPRYLFFLLIGVIGVALVALFRRARAALGGAS